MFHGKNLGWLVILPVVVLAACHGPVAHDDEPWHGNDVAGNWDPDAASITLEGSVSVNPVQTQQILVATVQNGNGDGLGGRRVEWMIPEGSLGTIVDVDKHGVYSSDGSLRQSRSSADGNGGKVDNTFAVTHTAGGVETLNMGTPDDASDDVVIQPGQTWIAITSSTEGTTDVIAYAPGVDSWADHKAFAKRHWMDVAWEFPRDATNKIGQPHRFTTMVSKYSDGSPLSNYAVTYRIVSGPAATFEGGGDTETVVTNVEGLASVVLNQGSPAAGRNVVEMSIVRLGNEACCEPDQYIAAGEVSKTFIAPAIGITKDAPAQVAQGEQFNYDIVVTNGATVATDNVVVTDKLPAGIEYVSSSPSGQNAGQDLRWELGTLAAGASRNLTVSVRATRTGRFENCADVTAEAGLSARDCATTVVVAPALKLDKSSPAQVTICDVIPFTFTVTNSGDGDATGVVIRDQLPDGLTTENGGNAVNIDVGTLGPGESRDYTVNMKASRTGEFTNTATARAEGGLEAEDSDSVRVVQAVLEIAKTGPDFVFAGRPVNYTVTVKNISGVAATDVVLIDNLPAGVAFEAANGGGTHSNGVVTWQLGNMAPGAERTVTIRVRATTIGQQVNTAAVRATCVDEKVARVTTDVAGIPAILLEVIDVADPIEVGGSETYEIRVTNQGTARDENIVIVATLPPEQTYASAAGPTQATVQGNVVTFASLPALAPKASVTYRVTSTANAVGDVRFAVEMTSTNLTSPVNETEATRQY